ncbi:hypothetical protein [Ureibacillus terrenus]|uniref:hypothetical protein n=1 Tax=Ureibacillus terrenus TaxID=118246 RepID=UPI002E231B92|nr:hypothetical protein [Ureibacillus terrenus]MED3764945.1 hypothetical protein [Ureibacillus terrenus]
MKEHRKTGHNVLHLLYPIRKKNESNCKNKGSLEGLLTRLQFERFGCSADNPSKENKNNIFSVYPSTFKKNEVFVQDSHSYWISEKQVAEYFHPTVQGSLFRSGNLKKYRKIEGEIFIADLKNPDHQEDNTKNQHTIAFQWLATEIYVFNEDYAFLVVRLSLLENVSVDKNDIESSLRQPYPQPVQSLNIWMKFANRVRQNYKKYATQPKLQITHAFNEEKQEVMKVEESSFFNYLEKHYKDLFAKYAISNVDLNGQGELELPQRIEPNAFLYAFVQTDSTEPLTNNELNQLIHIDDYDGESGSTPEFIDEFVNRHLYKRWISYGTYTTAIDYGSITISQNRSFVYSFRKSDLYKQSFPNLLIQHYSRIYLLFIVLLLYYREQLQDLLGRYALLGEEFLEESAKDILKDYYKLNQIYFFRWISQEIQGIEMWKFLYEIFGIEELYQSVVHDMQELNQRLIEKHTKKQEQEQQVQSKEIRTLTILAAFTGLLGINLIVPNFENDLSGIVNRLLSNKFWDFSDYKNDIRTVTSYTFYSISIIIIFYITFFFARKLVKWIVNKYKSIFNKNRGANK